MTSEASTRPNSTRQALESASAHWLNLVEIGILKTFIDYKVFDLIVDEGGISISELATKVGGDKALLERFSNYLVAADILSSPAPGCVAHTDCSRAYRTGEMAAGFIVHVYNFFLRPVAHWPEYFANNGLSEPKEAHIIPLGLGTGHPGLDMYGILDAEPKLAELFNRAQLSSAGIYSLKGVYDFGWMRGALSQSGDCPAIVDIGGGSGQALRDILADNVSIIPPERCAVFDLPKTIEQTKSEVDREGLLCSVQLIGGSMFQALPQPISGALVYQFRRVLSDFLDGDIVQALQQVREACVPESRVLIVEELLHPNRSKFSIAQDISVMNFGGKRRSEAMFRELAVRAGFQVNAVFEDKTSVFGVLELVPA